MASAIPVGTQFSPALFDLGAFARALVAHSGDKARLQDAIWQPGVRIRAPKRRPTKRGKSLPLEAAVQYGLLEKGSYAVTDLARKLAALSPPQLYEEFSRHVLLNCGGLRVIHGIQEMAADGRAVTGDELAAYLTSQGFRVTVHNTAINTLRMWLAKAGLFPEEGKADLWKLDPTTKERIVGLSDEAIGLLAGLDAEQRAFVEALCRINPLGWYSASEVRTLAEATFQMRLGRTSLPNEYLEPLRIAGLIQYKSGGTRGGKSALLQTTERFDRDVLATFVTRTTKDLDAAVATYYTRKPEEIYAELESGDTFNKGIALEAYAIHLMRLLGLRFRAWRKRAKETTGRAEVDAVFSGVIGAVPTRWQVQCKNTPTGQVDLEDVAKEVGLLPITQATHILLVANSRITKHARDFASRVMLASPVTVFLLDRTDFEMVKRSPGSLGAILRNKAEAIVRQGPPGSLFSS
jgi:restriction endonuclease